ncbi:VWD domain-containing protein [Granulosicoccus antarcticus]|nr:VWD domain-containing protein [Granulosicoccus antarcticus]
MEIACNLASGPVAQKICNDAIPYPSYEDFKDNCIDCILSGALGGTPCDESWGDPHMITRDGLRFNFHQEGDYALVVADELEVQVRLLGSIGYTNGVAVRAGQHTVSIDDSFEENSGLNINGELVFLSSGDWYELADPDFLIQRIEDGFRIEVDGFVKLAISGTTLTVQLNKRFAGATTGLLGDGDGDPGNDLRTAAGASVAYTQEELYGSYADDWRRVGDASLFLTPFNYTTDPSEGAGPQIQTLDELDPEIRRQARLQCLAAGVELGAGLDECTFDVAVTGDASLINDALSLRERFPGTLSAASILGKDVTAFTLEHNASVALNIPANGAGNLETDTALDRYRLADAVGEPQLLQLRTPCDGAVSISAIVRTESGSQQEILLSCESSAFINSDVAEIDVYSAAGDATNYTFDLITPATLDLGVLPLGQLVEGQLANNEVAVGTLPSAAGNTVYLGSEAGADCDVVWRVLDSTNEPVIDFASICQDLGLLELTESRTPFRVQIFGSTLGGNYALTIREPLQEILNENVPIAGAATLSAPSTVGQGAVFAVSWTGPGNPRDFIAIADVGAFPSSYSNFSYPTPDSDSVTLTAPGATGTYEIRYVLDPALQSENPIVAAVTLEVVESTVTLTAPEAAPAGSDIVIQWSGPNNPRDYIALAEPGAAAGSYETYEYLQEGSNEVELTLSVPPGDYELRYIVDSDSQILFRLPITVTTVTATVTAPGTAPAGSTIAVEWVGPMNDRDYISLSDAGASPGSYRTFSYLEEGTGSVALTVPGIPGNYEIRYVIDNNNQVLASVPITVTSVSASLSAPSTVASGSTFDVQWTGPANNRDYIAIAIEGDGLNSYESFRYVQAGVDTLQFSAPSAAGNYEIRYIIDTDRQLLASIPLVVAE